MITPDGIAEVVHALADDEDDRLAHITEVIRAVGEAYLTPILDATDDDYPEQAVDAAFLQVGQWAEQAARELHGLLRAVQP